ncbi:hypothetical protein GEMRC1_004561 [Eukaryota sp. GEM-RC1]
MFHHVILSTTSGHCILALALPDATPVKYKSLIDVVLTTQSFFESDSFSLRFSSFVVYTSFNKSVFCCLTSTAPETQACLSLSFAHFLSSSLLQLYSSFIDERIEEDNSCLSLNLSTYSVAQEIEDIEEPTLKGRSSTSCLSKLHDLHKLISNSSDSLIELDYLLFYPQLSEYVLRVLFPLFRNFSLMESFSTLCTTTGCHLVLGGPSVQFIPDCFIVNQVSTFDENFNYLEFCESIKGCRISLDCSNLLIGEKVSDSVFLLFVIPLSLEQGMKLRKVALEEKYHRTTDLESFRSIRQSFLSVDDRLLNKHFPVLARHVSQSLRFITAFKLMFGKFKSVDDAVKFLTKFSFIKLKTVNQRAVANSSFLPPPVPKSKPEFIRKAISAQSEDTDSTSTPTQPSSKLGQSEVNQRAGDVTFSSSNSSANGRCSSELLPQSNYQVKGILKSGSGDMQATPREITLGIVPTPPCPLPPDSGVFRRNARSSSSSALPPSKELSNVSTPVLSNSNHNESSKGKLSTDPKPRPRLPPAVNRPLYAAESSSTINQASPLYQTGTVSLPPRPARPAKRRLTFSDLLPSGAPTPWSLILKPKYQVQKSRVRPIFDYIQQTEVGHRNRHLQSKSRSDSWNNSKIV